MRLSIAHRIFHHMTFCVYGVAPYPFNPESSVMWGIGDMNREREIFSVSTHNTKETGWFLRHFDSTDPCVYVLIRYILQCLLPARLPSLCLLCYAIVVFRTKALAKNNDVTGYPIRWLAWQPRLLLLTSSSCNAKWHQQSYHTS
jgi:hypothetical protein